MRRGNAVALISQIREKANRFIVRELEARGIHGIVPSHGDIFSVLFRTKRSTMTELAIAIHRTKPTVTVLVEKLVDLGYLLKEKSDTDNRVTYIRLTQAGEELKPHFKEISAVLNGMVYRGLSKEEAETFEATLRNVCRHLECDLE